MTSDTGRKCPCRSRDVYVKGGMLKTRMKRVADRGDHAVRRLAEIEASIANLSKEDLLDLADISSKPNPAHQSGIRRLLKWRDVISAFEDRSGTD